MLAERVLLEEEMDDPDLDPAVYRAVLGDLAQVNRVTMASRPTLSFLKRIAGTRREWRILDVGYGEGDMLRRIARWAKAEGVAVRLVGIDLNAQSEPAAQAATPPDMAIDYRTGDYADLAGEGFDCIISSLVAHHMSDAQLDEFLRFMESEATAGWLVNDLHRHTFSYLGYPLLARIMGWHPIVRRDGQLSIARSLRPQEWHPRLAQAGITEAHIERFFPFRLCVTRVR